MKKIIFKHKIFFLIILSIICLISFTGTISKGLVNGMDFQWYPAKLFWKGINHYRFLIDGGQGFLAQNGEYGHALQVILYPFTLFEWPIARALWVFVNVFLALIIPYLLCRSFKISFYKSWIIILIFIICYPTRMTINYGQQSLFVLFFIILPYVYKSNFSYILSGFSYVKYSTGYIIYLNYLAQKKIKFFLLATLPPIVGWFIYFYFTNSNPIVNFFEPFEWILKKNYTRTADLYSLLNIYFNNILNKFFIILIIIVFNLFFLYKINKINNDLVRLSLVCILPLIFMPHSNYDYVLLLPLIVLGISNTRQKINKINFFL